MGFWTFLKTGTDHAGLSPALAAQARADADRDAGRWASAARHYARSLRLDPARTPIWVQYGHALKESGRAVEAEAAYRRATEQDPTDGDAALQLGHVLVLNRRPREAASAYARALELQPRLRSAIQALRELARQGIHTDDPAVGLALSQLRPRRRFRPGSGNPLIAAPSSTQAETPQGAAPGTYCFDVSDLLSYFRGARLPTGIQRVQIEVISALLSEPPPSARIIVCAFTELRDDWVDIPADLFLDLADAARADGALDDPDWRTLTDTLQAELELAPTLAFARGAWLINLGTSWWLQNYFLKVREAKRRFGVRYVPFVHDMIPVMAPEHCVRPLTRDFISWVQGVFAHADGWMTNSRASLKDLHRVAARLGRSVDETRVQLVPLDADFRPPATLDADPGQQAREDAQTLAQMGLAAEGFVLFVSTVESRKNHLEALSAWQALIERHGEAQVPELVCVGNHGWLNDAVFARLESDPGLQRRVRMRRGLSDAELATLYRQARFTLYPSLYEGWGLPITESLCHGTPVLAADGTALPEAGADFAIYYRAGDLDGLTHTLERMMFDHDWRRSLRADIVRRFRPRPWSVLARSMIDRLEDWNHRDAALPDSPPPVPELPLGRYMSMRRSMALAVHPGLIAAEGFRAGPGWHAPEDWGCRMRPGVARLVMRPLTDDASPLRLFIGLRGTDERALGWRMETAGQVLDQGTIAPDQTLWRALDVPPPLDGNALDLALISQPLPGDPTDPDTRRGLGLIGFMLCHAEDTRTRADFIEALTLGGLDTLEQNRT